MKRFLRLALAGSLLFFTPLVLLADSTNLHPAADTTLLESYPTNNMGGGTSMIVGKTPRGRARALVKFDLSSLPPSATITSVTFTFVVFNKHIPAVGSDFALHRALKDWGEGNKIVNIGDTATDGEASWINRFVPDQTWTPAGGGAGVDYATDPSATLFVDDLGTYTFSSASTNKLIADIQFWLSNPASNFGWMFLSQNESTDFTARRISSREDTFNPPTLTLGYTIGGQTPPPVPVISNVVLAGNQIRFSFQADANRTYAVESRSAVDAGTWAPLTNIPAVPAPTTIDVIDTVSGPSRFYRVRTP